MKNDCVNRKPKPAWRKKHGLLDALCGSGIVVLLVVVVWLMQS